MIANFVIQIKEPAVIAVVLIGVVVMLVDLWQLRNESDS